MSQSIIPSPADYTTQITHLRRALSLAKLSPPKPTNFRVGAVLVSNAAPYPILSTGYTLELQGNTHAEQCAFQKLSSQADEHTSPSGPELPTEGATLYTTMEPCILRLSGSKPCVSRIMDTQLNGARGITKVVCGATEPELFVGENKGRKKLEEAGVEVVYILDLQEEILAVATAGHVRSPEDKS